MKQNKHIWGWTATTKKWEIFKTKCQETVKQQQWKQWRWLLMKKPQPVAAEAIDDGILQNSTRKKPLKLSLAERTTMQEDAI
jgi:hypothetical protein